MEQVDKSEVLKDRDKFIGGSDTAVYGLNPFKSPYQLWLEKTGIEPNEFTGNDATEFGNVAEPIMSSCIEELYEDYSYNPTGTEYGLFRANADGLSKYKVIEFKTSKVANKSKYENPPITYWLQVQLYMLVFEKEQADIWFYFATPKQIENKDVSKIKLEKMIQHTIDRNTEVILLMAEMAKDFMWHVKTKTPPTDYLQNHEQKIKKIEELYKMSILEQLGVKNLAEQYRPYKSIIVYGKSGTGKTTFATKDGNALILDINEHGAGVATSGNVVEIKNWQHLKAVVQAIPELKKELGFDVLIIETLGKLRDIALTTLLAEAGRTNAQQRDYGDVAKNIKNLIEYLINMQQEQQFHLVLTGHESINGNTDQDGATINPTVSVDVQASIQSAVTTSVDVIAHAAIMKTMDTNNNPILKHVIDITPSELFVTKARTKNNITLETMMLEDASVSKLVRLVETGKVGE